MGLKYLITVGVIRVSIVFPIHSLQSCNYQNNFYNFFYLNYARAGFRNVNFRGEGRRKSFKDMNFWTGLKYLKHFKKTMKT